MNVGPTELLIVLAIVLLIFGSSKLPKLARSMGQARNEFKAGLDEADAANATVIAEKDTPAETKTDDQTS